ncbi:MAG: MaoC/PaaZ C-terminal domain-containing protein [Chloroflexota bacterium]
MSNTIKTGRYFEEFSVGDKVISVGRTITETDIVQYAALSGDYDQIHTDAEFASNSFYGQRVAHGMLVLSIAIGLAVRTGFIEGTAIALRNLDCKFSAPTFIGDTIHTEMEVTSLRPFPRLGGGAVELDVKVLNHDDKIVSRGSLNVLIANKPS